MLRFLLYTALALNFSALAATATDRYGGWLLEQPRSSVRTLSFKQTVQLNNKIETLELGFICDQRKSSKNFGVILIPFNGTFQNDRNVVPVLIQKNADQYDPSDLLQNWKNGVEFIFSEAKDDIDGLVSFMKADEMDGAKSVYFIFPNDTSDGPQTSPRRYQCVGFFQCFRRVPNGMRVGPIGFSSGARCVLTPPITMTNVGICDTVLVSVESERCSSLETRKHHVRRRDES
jgi:hypothetical protein